MKGIDKMALVAKIFGRVNNPITPPAQATFDLLFSGKYTLPDQVTDQLEYIHWDKVTDSLERIHWDQVTDSLERIHWDQVIS